jgi:hypothetical protein
VKKTVNRRTLLKTGASAAVLATAASTAGLSQVFGTDPEGGTVPLRLPKGAMTDLDGGQYISNMEIHSHLTGATVNGGEPFGSLWSKGAQRRVRAIDEDTANAGSAHFSKGDLLLAGEGGHAPMIPPN